MITRHSPPRRTLSIFARRFIYSASSASSAVIILLMPAVASGQVPARDPSRCAPQMLTAPLGDPSAGPRWNGWSPTVANTRFQSGEQAGLTAAQVPGLTLKWAFGFPDTL